MTVQEAIEKLKYIKYIGNGEQEYKKCSESIAIDMAIEALEKQSKLTNVIGQIQELANKFQEDKQYEVHCKDRCNGCLYKDCCACALERAIEIIKQEMM